jgi:cellulose synthase/poly-beta-1,6-N-acetylglucosamine synthase-like glycosyltransferase
MEALATTALLVVTGVPAFLTAIFVVQVVAAVLRPVGSRIGRSALRGQVAVIVPAHNEGAALLPTLEDVQAQLAPGDCVLVVADNCTDDTAIVARRSGAEVIERSDAQRLGKGYALDFGVEHLRRAPPDIVVVIDADCRVASGAIDDLARCCEQTRRPCQALNLMQAPQHSSISYNLPMFAWRVKNWVRPLGMMALGLPCQLMGTGMAFRWAHVSDAKLASGHTVEDLELGIELAREGNAALFCPSALVTSEFPQTLSGAQTQRERWEGGHITMIATVAVPAMLQGVRDRNRDLFALALDLAVPPLMLLALALITTFGFSLLWLSLGFSAMPLVISSLSLVGFALAVVVCWFRYGRDLLSARALIAVGPFVWTKLQLYCRIVGGRTPSRWVRTERKSGDDR